MKPATPATLSADVLSSYRQQRELEKLTAEAKAALDRSGDEYWRERVAEYTQRTNEIVAFRDQAEGALGKVGLWTRHMQKDKPVGVYGVARER